MSYLLSHDWKNRLNHFWREGNSCAVVLAKVSLSMPSELKLLWDPPDEIWPLLFSDYTGLTCYFFAVSGFIKEAIFH